MSQLSKCHNPSPLIAHRGYARLFPENTLLAIREAIRAGARHVEVDVQLSCDGIAMLYHDDTLHRISGQPGEVFGLSADELETLPAHDPVHFGARYLNTRISRLDKLVTVMNQHPGVHFYIELKEESINHFGLQACLAATSHALAGRLNQCTLISFDETAVMAARQSGFTQTGIVLRNWEQRHRIITACQADIAYINYKRIPFWQRIEASCPVAVYEVSRPGLARKLLARGASYIETFDIGKLARSLC